MPIIDMPLEELRRYQGLNPRPDDFDAYWTRALAELAATDPDPRWMPAPFAAPGVDCRDLTFTGVRGARIHAKYLRPTAPSGPHPAIVHFHGYAGNAGSWLDKLAWVQLGFSVAAMDVRGQGGSSEDVGGVRGPTLHGHIIRGLSDDPDNLLFRHIFLDTVQLVRLVMVQPEVDPERVAVTGWSQGGGLTVAAAALEPRVWKAAPVYPFLSDYRRVWEMDLARDAYQELRDYFRLFDPEHRREADIFRTLGYIDIQHLAPRIRGAVLWGTGLMDTICPPSTQFAAYNRVLADKRMILYPDFGHENLPDMHDHIARFMLGQEDP